MQPLNSTFIQMPNLPWSTNLLKILIPGFGLWTGFLSNALGFDVTAAVCLGLLLFGIIKSFDLLRRQFLNTIVRYTTCSVSFDSHADAYHWVLDLLQAKGVGKTYYDLIAISNPSANANIEIGYEIDGQYIPIPKGEETHKNKPKVRYEPALGSTQWFWHGSHLFIWQRWKESREQGTGFGSLELTDRIRGRLHCFATSTKPIKGLVRDAIEKHASKNASKTTVRRPASSRQRRNGGVSWVKVTTRPSRSLDSVILDDQEKCRIKNDIDEFLSTNTRRWYADRGIPYRRGYLLNGPPGTGKTSLSFALAGVFSLDIYCVSLAEASMTEEDLAKLFDNLPEQCLVLLEDIDAAGLAFRGNLSKERSDVVRMEHHHNRHDGEHLCESGEDDSHYDDSPQKNAGSSRISLSGLLNVIDGVAASEGRLLFMTTNNVSGLDRALLRPGRIDLTLQFSLATRRDAELLFKQIFHNPNSSLSQQATTKTQGLFVVESLASTFAQKVPEGKIGQAEIQGYLMFHKSDPARAIEQADGWVTRSLAAKAREA